MASPQDTVFLGRRAGQTTTADWIRLAPISSQARDVYGILKMHMETFIGSGEDPFPAQELIASIMKCSQSAVSRYVAELVRIGAVETTRRKVPGGGLQYRLHETPPEGYTGPTTLAEYIPRYLAAKAAANDPANAESANDLAPVAANGTTVATSRPTKPRTNGAATNGTTVARANGAPLPDANDAANANANDAALGRLLAEAEALGMFDGDVSARPKITSRLRSMLAEGWAERELHPLLTEQLGGADSRAWVALRHLRDAQDRRVRLDKTKTEQPPPGPKCGKGGAHSRFPAADCKECKIEEIEAARAAAPKTGVVYGTAFTGSRR